MNQGAVMDQATASQPGSARAALARRVADAVLSVPGVARLVAGDDIEVATQHAGGRVLGVRLGDTVALCLVVDELPVQDVCERARVAAREVLAAAGQSAPITVTVADLDDRALRRRAPGSAAPGSEAAGSEAAGPDVTGQAAGPAATGQAAPRTAVQGEARVQPVGEYAARPAGVGSTGRRAGR